MRETVKNTEKSHSAFLLSWPSETVVVVHLEENENKTKDDDSGNASGNIWKGLQLKDDMTRAPYPRRDSHW
ncbi:hypothetical protein OUZ56_007673 [Daphnia magna]|uniref:Uncharacterized protein n=1 Tax=Daphnia magna TaxID=35525 RepID=A0ABR0AB04_9CRUS|nr:hypothetical protein OUZ56_007673 [Daphnia magna]